MGLPAMITRYEQAAGLHSVERVVVDREGMAAEFLAALASEGRTVITVLRTDQYSVLESFREVGEFLPLRVDRQGQVTREVALARFSISYVEDHLVGTSNRGLTRETPDELHSLVSISNLCREYLIFLINSHKDAVDSEIHLRVSCTTKFNTCPK